MSRVDSGDGGLSAEGTGRVFYGKRAGVLRSYTLECNYNTGKVKLKCSPALYFDGKRLVGDRCIFRYPPSPPRLSYVKYRTDPPAYDFLAKAKSPPKNQM